MQDFQQQLAYQFRDVAWLERALTHRSCATEHLERLEFLGDAVLSLVISEYLHCTYPDVNEGELSKLRANLVCRDRLLEVAALWSLDQVVHVGGGERDAAGRIRSVSILADAVEACIGAVFSDGGWDAVRHFVLDHWKTLLSSDRMQQRDAKSLLQEYTQSKGWGLPEYQVTEQRSKKNHHFVAHCYVQGVLSGEGKGERKKYAQILAAEQAWKTIQQKT
ncbi:MAG: ribonuclease III [Mariprofundaceae bacterium]|nr:ribonuclease III [Mariprofundaceae bacterium]